MLRTITDMVEVEVRFLETAGPSHSLTYTKRHDDLVIAQGHFLLVVHGCHIGDNSKTQNENYLST